MKNVFLSFQGLVIFIAIVIFVSCQKEISEETLNGNNGGSGGGGSTSFTSGWSYTNSTTTYAGCVDTAYYETVNGMKFLSVEGTDATGNGFVILVAAASGKLSATTYTAVQGAALMVEDANGNQYISGATASSFSFTVTSVTDTSIAATFKASLTDGISTTAYTITNGSIKALIGKPNTCTQAGGNTGGGSGGGTGGGTGTGTGSGGSGTGGSGTAADYSLVSSGSNCSDVSIESNFHTTVPLTSANKVTLKVNVTKTGGWSLNTETENGMKFTGSGNFTNTGVQTIVLTGSGTPTIIESTTFDIVAGSSECKFFVPVIANGTASCNPANNSINISGLMTTTFNSVYKVNSSWSGYTIQADAMGISMVLEFAGTAQPKPGVYHIKNTGMARAVDDVGINMSAQSIWWQSSDGELYVTVKDGKVTATMCEVPFSGSLGSPSFKAKVTTKVTEQ